MSLARYFYRSARPIITVLQQNARQKTLNSKTLIERQLLYPSRVASWCVVRSYAKKVDKAAKKEKELKAKAAKFQLSEHEIDGIIDLEALKAEFQAVVDNLKHEYIHSLALRTTSASFEQLQIQTGDGLFPLNQLAQVIQKTPTLTVINLSAMPQYTGDVLQALRNSGMNINPQQEGTHTIYVPVPKISREHRENLAKSAKTHYTQAKTKLRNVQNKYDKRVHSKENTAHHSRDLIEKLTKMVIEQMHMYDFEAEKLMKAKQKELLGDTEEKK